MKITKFLAASIAAMTLVSVAQANELIRVTGSTAFRASAVKAIEAFLGTGTSGAFVPASTGSTDETKANYLILQNTVGGVVYTFQITWTGSVGGIIANTKQDDIKNIPTNGWLSTSNLATAQGSNGVGIYPILTTATYDSAAEPADVNFSDSLQGTTGFNTPALLGAGTSATNNGSGAVGVIPFDWVFGNSNTVNGTAATPPAVTNITSLQARALLSGGAFLSTLDGVASDTTKAVYIVGRNFDSGTRLSQFIETGYGFFTNPQQVSVVVSGGSLGAAGTTITNVNLYPADTLYSGQSYQRTYALGQSGYASGGNVGQILSTPGSVGSAHSGANTNRPAFEKGYGILGGYLIGYLGRSDAATAIGKTVDSANTAFKLNYDGVADTDANIQEGLYHGWEVEYMYYSPRTTNPLDANQISAINSIADSIYTTWATTAGLSLGSMHVSKAQEGAVITHN